MMAVLVMQLPSWRRRRRIAKNDIERAKRHLAHVQAREVDVDRVVSKTKEVINEDGFGPLIAEALGESRKP